MFAINSALKKNLPLGGELRSSQLSARLLEQIAAGRYAECEMLPSELELCNLEGVSRAVVRDTLSELERFGAIERVRGIGTMINHDVVHLENRIDHKLEFYQMIRSVGQQPESDHLFVTKEEASTELAKELHLPQDNTILVYVCKRVLADNRPVLHSTDILPLFLFGSQRPETMDFNRPIFDILEELGQPVTSTVAHISATMGESAVRRQLDLPPEKALLCLEEVCYTRLCQPVLHSRTYYTDFFDFSIVRKLM